jgi:hypothetical protein
MYCSTAKAGWPVTFLTGELGAVPKAHRNRTGNGEKWPCAVDLIGFG